MTHWFLYYNLVVATLSGLGLLYLLYSQTVVIEVRRFLVVTTLGLVLFVVGGSIASLFLPSAMHLIHGIAALMVILGLYDPVRNDLRQEQWARVFLQDPSTVRAPAEWMVPMDDAILQLFHSSDLILTPAIIATNIDYSREEVNRRLTTLNEHGLVDRVDRGKYRITALGEQYLAGRLHRELLTADR